MTRLLRWPCLVVLVLGIVPRAPACTIPVFRYALERWELSAYELVVFHRGNLAPDARKVLASLPRHANLLVTAVDLDAKPKPALRKLWERQGKATLPWAVLRGSGAGTAPPVWAGPLDVAALREAIESPARQKIVAALSHGDAGVFVVLRSGDPAADAAAERLVQRELTKLERLVKLPEQTGVGPRIRLALPLKVSFTVLPLRRDEPGEGFLIQQLLDSEDGLATVDGPIVFPIFGRGRLLGSLSGADFSADSLFDVVSFLCGECSCQVKELNPGMDLLIAADWPAIFARIGPAPESGPEAPPGATRRGARVKPHSGPLPFPPGASKDAGSVTEGRVPESHDPEAADVVAASPTPPHRPWLWGATAAAGLLVLATGAWAAAQRRRPRLHQKPSS